MSMTRFTLTTASATVTSSDWKLLGLDIGRPDASFSNASLGDQALRVWATHTLSNGTATLAIAVVRLIDGTETVVYHDTAPVTVAGGTGRSNVDQASDDYLCVVPWVVSSNDKVDLMGLLPGDKVYMGVTAISGGSLHVDVGTAKVI